MSGRYKDWTPYIGEKYNRLTVIDFVNNYQGRDSTYFLCRCDCGNEKYILTRSVLTGHTKSCGCLTHIYRHTTDKHLMKGTRLYNIWTLMKGRCNNPNNHKYNRYGGRGIKVCEEWQSFEPFMEWSLSHGYADNLTIDRIDNNGNYEPSNCRWTTSKIQSRNTSRNHLVTYKGITKPLIDWSEELNIKYDILKYHLSRNNNDLSVVIKKLFAGEIKYVHA